ncbi:MAG: hypothetical protein E6Q97_30580 [Desulfurellales bacterium]|nr:MAG: hypothetical protein E6Q97_30580 [Desulfurellales bacterium]
MARGDRSAPAYRHVDLSQFSDDIRAEIIGDAEAGGREFGIVMVEVVHNGPAQTPIYGVYNHAEEQWAQAKVELGIEEAATDVDLTAEAAETASQQAEAMAAAETAEIEKISGGKKGK